ncbi:MAG: nfrA2 [Herbinix sp.]|nr:nfrA2 [Herbinix sp.]
MSFLELTKARYSVRGYQENEVEKDKMAPSAVNFQPVHLYVLEKKEDKEKLYEVYNREWFKEAPVVLAICGDHTKSWNRKDGKDHCDIDAAIVIDHMTLAAVELGLGTCWICAFDAQRCHEILGLSDNLEVIALLTIGYANVLPSTEKKRKSMEEFATFGLN